MKIAIFTDEHRQKQFAEMIDAMNCTFYLGYDDFIGGLPESNCESIIVARDGAEGMESVRAARILLPQIPIIWFSDDNGFGPESYRVGCNYFSASPISKEILIKALKRCEI